jgi:hypothetical protein
VVDSPELRARLGVKDSKANVGSAGAHPNDGAVEGSTQASDVQLEDID